MVLRFFHLTLIIILKSRRFEDNLRLSFADDVQTIAKWQDYGFDT
jgi:hypothetical protein